MATPFDVLGAAGALKDLTGGLFGGKEEIKLEQQKTGVLPRLSDIDEAIELALDQFIGRKHPDEMAALTRVRQALRPDQRAAWRHKYTKLDLTEKHELVLLKEDVRTEGSRKVNIKAGKVEWPRQQRQGQQGQRQQQNQQNQPNQQGVVVPGQQDITFTRKRDQHREWDRQAHDYEYTDEDPRILHLRYVAQLVIANAGPRDVQVAVDYLLAAQLIPEKTLNDKFDAATDEAYKPLVRMQIGRENYDRIMQAPISEDEKRQRVIERSQRRRDASERLLKREQAKSLPITFWVIAGSLSGVSVFAIIVLAILQYTKY